jgi:hypothetical protein
MYPLRQFLIRQGAVALQQIKNAAVKIVKISQKGG